jgi:glutathione synthase
MRHLFVIDPIESLGIHKDTSFAFMLEAQARGHEVWYCLVEGIGADRAGGYAHAAPVRLQHVVGAHFERGEFVRRSFDDFNVIWMRKDPPVDIQFINATLILDCVNPAKTLVVNRPQGLRNANEKAFILQFPELITDTVISRDINDILAFVRDVGGVAVLKPLDMMGGTGIFKLDQADSNMKPLIENVTSLGTRYVMVQRFLPQIATEGDKRVLLLNGEPLGALLRIPQKNEFRSNLAYGGNAVKTTFTARDLEIVERIGDRLRAEGLWFVGLDVVAGFLTEVNCTSPTGLPVVNRLDGSHLETKVLDWVASVAPASV